MESALPVVDKSEGLPESQADDVACLFRLKKRQVDRYDTDSEGVAGCPELGGESLQMIENSLFRFLHLLR